MSLPWKRPRAERRRASSPWPASAAPTWIAPSKTDLVAEVANRAAATALYRANLQALANARETGEALVHLVR